jgi:hypothetical protein
MYRKGLYLQETIAAHRPAWGTRTIGHSAPPPPNPTQVHCTPHVLTILNPFIYTVKRSRDFWIKKYYVVEMAHCTENPIYVFPEMNCSASIPISTFMYLWAIYIFPGSIWLFCCSQIGRPILGILYINCSQIHECENWETEHYNSGKNEAAQIPFWEHINRNQTFILDSHWPFICSADPFTAFCTWRSRIWNEVILKFSVIIMGIFAYMQLCTQGCVWQGFGDMWLHW